MSRFSYRMRPIGRKCLKSRFVSGFSMLEILIVVLLLTVVVTMLFPVFQSNRDTAKLAVCTGNLKQIFNGYVAESIRLHQHLIYPGEKGWQTQVEAVVNEPDIMVCPMDNEGHIKSNDAFEYLSEPPESVAPFSGLESDSKIYVFREKESFALPQDLSLVSEPGFYGSENKGATINNFNFNGVISAGTSIDVYYFHYDPITADNGGQLTEISFSEQILGFIGYGLDLEATDDLLGHPDVAYSPHFAMKHRGVDDARGQYGDAVFLPEGKESIDYHQSYANPKNGGTDGMRLITVEGAGTSYGLNKSLPKHAAGEHIFLTDANFHLIDFDGIEPDDEFNEAVDPRHFGKVNVLFSDGSVRLMDVDAIQPNSLFWRR